MGRRLAFMASSLHGGGQSRLFPTLRCAGGVRHLPSGYSAPGSFPARWRCPKQPLRNTKKVNWQQAECSGPKISSPVPPHLDRKEARDKMTKILATTTLFKATEKNSWQAEDHHKILLQEARSHEPASSSTSGPRAASLRPGPSRSLQTSPGGPEHALPPPAEPRDSSGRTSRELARETKRRRCSQLEARSASLKAAMTDLQPDFANPAAPEVASLADERGRTPSPALRCSVHAPGPNLYAAQGGYPFKKKADSALFRDSGRFRGIAQKRIRASNFTRFRRFRSILLDSARFRFLFDSIKYSCALNRNRNQNSTILQSVHFFLARVCVCIYMYMCVCMCVYVCVCMVMCVCMCVYVCMRV